MTELFTQMASIDLPPEDIDVMQPGVAEMALFSPMAPKVRANPYPIYHRLREQDPVHFSPFGTCLLTRYTDAVAVLRDKRFSVEHRNYVDERQPNVLGSDFGPAPSERDRSNVMLFIDLALLVDTDLALFRTVAEETLDWALKEMRGPEGGFFSALDRGSQASSFRYSSRSSASSERREP